MDRYFPVAELGIKHPQPKITPKQLQCPTCNHSRFSAGEMKGEESREQTQGQLATMKSVSLKIYRHPLQEKIHLFHTVA